MWVSSTYTKQQRQGGSRYGTGTLIGNWNEDVELQGSELKDFLTRQSNGMLRTERYDEKRSGGLNRLLTGCCRGLAEPSLPYNKAQSLLTTCKGG